MGQPVDVGSTCVDVDMVADVSPMLSLVGEDVGAVADVSSMVPLVGEDVGVVVDVSPMVPLVVVNWAQKSFHSEVADATSAVLVQPC